jgi:hypothetical protein
MSAHGVGATSCSHISRTLLAEADLEGAAVNVVKSLLLCICESLSAQKFRFISLKLNSGENWSMKNESFLISAPDNEKLQRVGGEVPFLQ